MFFNEVNARLQVKTKVDEAPLDALPLVLLLLQDEHGVVEELLQLLIGVVDTQLFKWVQLSERIRKTKVLMIFKCILVMQLAFLTIFSIKDDNNLVVVVKFVFNICDYL